MSRAKGKNAKKAKRITVGHHELREIAEQHRQIQETHFPGRNVIVTGTQGNWKVRRDATPGEQPPNLIRTNQYSTGLDANHPTKSTQAAMDMLRSCPGHGDDVDCEDDPQNPCINCIEVGNYNDNA